ncbi:hypothetical protein [Streptomyces katrae]|uniref:hypothetical protein n=1 Tax=Streptomyces katrae TaxID=68223 RepID=UPI00131D9BC4|nr:hypothetical protein [Streptomyces katrae]
MSLMSSVPSVRRTMWASVASSEQRQPALGVPFVLQRAQTMPEPVSVSDPCSVNTASSPAFLGVASVVMSAVGGMWSTRK